MIKDQISFYVLYAAAHPRLAEALEFLANPATATLAVGRYEIRGSEIFALVQEYDTREPLRFEAHENYIDIQFIASGSEKIGLADLADLTVTEAYNPEKDITRLEGKSKNDFLMTAGDFMVIFPHEPHQPGIHPADTPVAVRKVVVKVAV